MKKSGKITIAIVIFFIIIAMIIAGRYAMGLHFKKKFSKRPPPGVIVEVVANKNFNQTLEKAGRVADFIELAVQTGYRKQELLGLEWERVDLTGELFYLQG